MLVIETNNFIKISQNEQSNNVISAYEDAKYQLAEAWSKHKGKQPSKNFSTMTSLTPGGMMLNKWDCLKDKILEKGRPELIESLTRFLIAFKQKGDELVKEKRSPYGSDNPYKNIRNYNEDPRLHSLVQSLGLTPEADKAGEIK